MAEPQDKKPKEPPKTPEGDASDQEIEAEAILTVTLPEEELNQLKQEAAEYKDKYLRQLAETDNMRKRLQKERQEMIQFSVQNVIADFLAPLDHFENALKFADQASDEVKHWALGFQMILSQFKDVLANNGVVAFQSEGTPFDPHSHEAVETVATNDYPPGTVVSESIKGYRMGGKTIRPARVSVAMPLEQPDMMNQQNNNEV